MTSGTRDRRRVLCLHGLTGSPAELRPLIDSLASSGFLASAPLLAGHGADAATLAHTTRVDWLQSARDALDALAGDQARPVSIVGASAGGLLAMVLAAEQPARVDRLVLIAPAVRFGALTSASLTARALASRVLPFATSLATLPKRGGIDVVDPAGRVGLQSLDECPLVALLELRSLMREARVLLPAVRQPTLVVHGRLDRTVPRLDAERLVRRLAATAPVEVLWLDQSGHLAAVDRERHVLAARVARFLE